MTDFGLSSGYRVHNGLDQSETGWIESGRSLTSYFSAGTFVNDTIWVGNCQAFTQYALDIASEFFEVNDISINNKKTVAISINQGVKVASLSICEQPISIAKKDKAHCYLGIFLFTEGLSKPSVAKAHADIRFFVNIVLKKTIMDKQFLYLVLAVLQLIVSYCIQFSFVPSSVCHKFKTCLPHDFLDAALYYPLLYGLKPFEQVQSEGKVAALIMFFNTPDILGYLFSHRFLDLQVLGWAPLDPLQFFVRLCVSSVNNFLAGLVKIFLDNELSLANNLPTAFHSSGHFFLFFILGKFLYFDSVKSFKHFGVFVVASEFFLDKRFLLSGTLGSIELRGLNVLGSSEFSAIKNRLHDVWLGFFEVYTDGFLKNTGSTEVVGGAAAYFLVLDLSIGVAVWGLLFSTMAKLQTVALSLECITSSSTVILHLDSQAAIDACISEMFLATPNFCNQCWLERHHIFNLVRNKDLNMSWTKVKDYSGIFGNVRADLAAGAAFESFFLLLVNVCEHFLVAEDTAVSGNVCHFVQDIFRFVCHACWEAGPGCNVVSDVMIGCVDWVATARVWHLDSYMLAGFTSCKSSTLCSYMMKAVHRRLPVAVRKRLYNRCYPGVLCLLCDDVEFSDHAFICVCESNIHNEILVEAFARWSAVAGVFDLLSQCSIDVGLYALVCKEFVLDEWLREACCIVDDQKLAVAQIVDFIRFIVELHYARVWLVRSSHWVVMKKTGLVQNGSVVFGLFLGVSSLFSDGIVRLLGMAKFFAVSFGHQKPCSFFSGLGGNVQVIIGV
ncbi:hypothetical protein G9A89_007430 [Geosiphon pyriformis]|nr:hypothetical protein G9A89_007430 [Geosiphon pyriformis]